MDNVQVNSYLAGTLLLSSTSEAYIFIPGLLCALLFRGILQKFDNQISLVMIKDMNKEKLLSYSVIFFFSWKSA